MDQTMLVTWPVTLVDGRLLIAQAHLHVPLSAVTGE